MTGGRMILASLLGGLVLFLWGFLSHAVLPLGHVGVRDLTSGETELAALLKQHMPEDGIYTIPSADMDRMGEDEAYSEEIMARMKAGPYAFMAVRPGGVEPMMARHLTNQYATCVGMALIATFLIVVAGGLSGPIARIAFCVLLSLFGALQTEVPNWNWYAFPGDFTLAQVVDHVVGGALLGLTIHLLIPKRS
jgi:hypothetical protein